MSKKKPLFLLGAIGLLVVDGATWGLPIQPSGNQSSLAPNSEEITLSISQRGNQTNSFSDVPEVPDGEWLYGGSTTWAPIRGKVDPKIQELFPRFRLIYQGHPGSGNGIKMLIEGKIAFAQSSRPLKDEEFQRAKDRGFELDQIPVARDGIAIVVHPDLDIRGLTVEQLKDIYTGKIQYWSDIGGPGIPIIPYARPDDSGTTPFFKKEVLNGKKFGINVSWIPTTTDALREVEVREGAIYFATASDVVPKCSGKPLPISNVAPYKGDLVPPKNCPRRRNQPNLEAFQNGTYPITRRLFVIVKKDGSYHQKAGEAYANLLLTDEGQMLIEEAGYAPIRSPRQ